MLNYNENTNRTAIFIDGSNIYHTMKHLGWKIDWKRLKNFFENGGNLVNASYYMVEKKPLSGEKKKLQYKLRRSGYKIVKKDLKEIHGNSNDSIKYKGDMDVDLVVDAMDSVETFDTFILLSGDSDFVRLVQSLDAKNKVVKVVSSSKKGTARELIDAVGMNHISLENLRPHIEMINNFSDVQKLKPGFQTKPKYLKPEIGEVLKKENPLPKIGDIIKTKVLHSKDYGVFLENKWKLKVLLPLSNLGIKTFVPTTDGIFDGDDKFLAQITNVKKTPNGVECMAALNDIGMRHKIVQRLSV